MSSSRRQGGCDCAVWPSSAVFTDLYQVTMAYAYWLNGKHEQAAVFDLFIRKCPFRGRFAVFAGWAECRRYVAGWRFTDDDIAYLRSVLPATVDPAFFDYLAALSTKDVIISCVREGEVVFPRVPLVTVRGPLAVCQLLETPLLNFVNYASLCATCARRHRLAASGRARLVEMGLRRAQGPNGAMAASKFCYLGGFDGTSNVEAGRRYGIPVRGTQAHAFVTAFHGDEQEALELASNECSPPRVADLRALSAEWRRRLLAMCNNGLQVFGAEPNDSELAAFVAYARAFPSDFLALVDTYDTLRSGLVNFCAVALSLDELGYKPVGVRLDSGNLAELSRLARKLFTAVGDRFDAPWLKCVTIVASNDLNERKLQQLAADGHSIHVFGIGTHVVTCDEQPALGGVYKLVSLAGVARMKLSQELGKVTLPGDKRLYRLYDKRGGAVLDLVCLADEPMPAVGEPVMCRHPVEESKRLCVTPSRVVDLRQTVSFCDGQLCAVDDAGLLLEARQHLTSSMATFDQAHFRLNDALPYKVSLSEQLYQLFHSLWLQSAPVPHIE